MQITSKNKEKGFSLMEVMIAAALLVILVGTMRLVQIQVASINTSKVRTTGMALANRLMEEREADPNLIQIGESQANLQAQDDNTYTFRINAGYIRPDGTSTAQVTNLVRVRIDLLSPSPNPPGTNPTVNSTLVENIITLH